MEDGTSLGSRMVSHWCDPRYQRFC